MKTNLWCHYLIGDHFVEDNLSKPATHFFLQISFLKNYNLLSPYPFNKVQHGKWPISVFNISGNLMIPFSSLLNRNFKMRSSKYFDPLVTGLYGFALYRFDSVNEI